MVLLLTIKKPVYFRLFHALPYPAHSAKMLFGYKTSWRIASIRFRVTLGGNSSNSPFSWTGAECSAGKRASESHQIWSYCFFRLWSRPCLDTMTSHPETNYYLIMCELWCSYWLTFVDPRWILRSVLDCFLLLMYSLHTHPGNPPIGLCTW